MAVQFCTDKIEVLTQLVHLHGILVSTICVLNLIFSFVATFGNLLVIHALWKVSSIPTNLKKLFLSLAFCDLAVGLFAQLMFGVIIAVMLKMAANGNYNFDFLCPTIVTVCYFVFSRMRLVPECNRHCCRQTSRCFSSFAISRTCHFKMCYYSLGVFMVNKCCRCFHIRLTS